MTSQAVPFETVVKNALVHDLEGCVRGSVTWYFVVPNARCMNWQAVRFETVVQNAMVHDLEGCFVRNSRQKCGVAPLGRLARSKQSSKMWWCRAWKARPCETVVKNAMVQSLEGCFVRNSRQKCDGA